MFSMLSATLSSCTSSLASSKLTPVVFTSASQYCDRCVERTETLGKSKTTVAGTYSFNLSAPKAAIRVGELTNPFLSSTALSESIPASINGSSWPTSRPRITLTADMMVECRSTSAPREGFAISFEDNVGISSIASEAVE